MSENRSSVSQAQSYKELAEFWDSHELSDYWDRLQPTEFEVDIQSEVSYFPLEASLSAELRSIARKRGVPPEALLILWVHEKVREDTK
jgi:hypothetical protein